MNLPNRHRNHEIQTLSERFLTSKIPYSWVLNHFHVDYGTDYNCEIAFNRMVSGLNFTLQLKGKEKEDDDLFVKLNIKSTTINRWNNRLEPTMLVAYVVNEDEAYWDWFNPNSVDLTKQTNSFTIKIPRENKLSKINWDKIAEKIKQIFSKKHLLYSMPELTITNETAWSLYFEGKYDKALNHFYELIISDSQNALLYEAIAVCEYVLFNYNKALLNINKALEVEKNDSILMNKASILTEIGSLNNDNKKVDEAIKIYEIIIQKQDNISDLYYNMGSALTKKADYINSIKYFYKAINLNPNNPQYWNNLGNSYMNIGEHKNEMECYEKALMLNPNLSEALFSKGSSLFRYFGQVDEGLRLMLEASEKSKRHEIDNPYFFFWISEAYLEKKDFVNSKKWNDKGLIYFSDDIYLTKQAARIFNKESIF